MDNIEKYKVLWQVCLTILHLLAIVSSVFRLYRRRKIAQFWWDDWVAAFALLFDVLFFPTLWFPTQKFRTANAVASSVRDINFAIANSWLIHTALVFVLWSTRISIGLSMTRIMPPKSRFYYANLGLVYALIVAAFSVIAFYVVRCGSRQSAWSKTPPYKCFPELGMQAQAIIAFVDVISDFLLVVVPIWTFWKRINLQKESRRFIKACFFVNSITAFAGLTTWVTFLEGGEKFGKNVMLVSRIFLHIFCTVSLLACNSLVVLTSLYRTFRSKDRRNVREQKLQPVLLNERHQAAISMHHISPHPTATFNLNTINGSPGVMTGTASRNNTNMGSSSEYMSSMEISSPLVLTEFETDPSLLVSNGGRVALH